MTNEDKAASLSGYDVTNEGWDYPENKRGLCGKREYEIALEMAEWKDAQFKEYLEKKYSKIESLFDKETDSRLIDIYYDRMICLTLIIIELFGGE